MSMRPIPPAGFAGLMAALLAVLALPTQAQSIYTCVDSKGRTLTSDRPIIDCLDRPQKELNPSGTVRRQVGPSLTAAERAAEDEKARKAAEEEARIAEEKRRDRALLVRYPSRAVHDEERETALSQVDAVIAAAQKRIGELKEQRTSIDAEAEFYRRDPSKMPASIKRRIDENDQSMTVQRRFIQEQEAEKKRVSVRFDEELVKLKVLWARQASPVTDAAPAAARKP